MICDCFVAEPGGAALVHRDDDVLHGAGPALVAAPLLGAHAGGGAVSAAGGHPPPQKTMPPGEDPLPRPAAPPPRRQAPPLLVQLPRPPAVFGLLHRDLLVIGGLDERRDAVRQPSVREGGVRGQIGEKRCGVSQTLVEATL